MFIYVVVVVFVVVLLLIAVILLSFRSFKFNMRGIYVNVVVVLGVVEFFFCWGFIGFKIRCRVRITGFVI